MAKIGLLCRAWTYEIGPVPFYLPRSVKQESRIRRDPERAENSAP